MGPQEGKKKFKQQQLIMIVIIHHQYHIITSLLAASVAEFLAELVADVVDQSLVNLYDLVLLLDLLVQGLPQILNSGGNLHLLLGHYHSSALLRHLRLQVLDHGLRPLHFL